MAVRCWSIGGHCARWSCITCRRHGESRYAGWGHTTHSAGTIERSAPTHQYMDVDEQAKEHSMARYSWPTATGGGPLLLWRLGFLMLMIGVGGMLLGLVAPEPALASAAVPGSPFTAAGEHSFVVPSGVTSLQVVVIGAAGGTGGKACSCQNGGPDGAPGGQGAATTATVSVTPGQTIWVEVGGNGGNGSDHPSGNCYIGDTDQGGSGGTNGGGSGGTSTNCWGGGGGGGGYSALRVCPLSGNGCPANPWLVV